MTRPTSDTLTLGDESLVRLPGMATLLESGVPAETRAGLAALGWTFGPSDGTLGGYQCIQRWPGRYAAATEMRKDGVALAY